MPDAAQFMTHSLSDLLQGGAVARILACAVQAVDPQEAVHRYLQLKGNMLAVADATYNLDNFHRVLVVGVGKASQPMSIAAASVLEDHLTAGMAISKVINVELNRQFPGRIEVLRGDHPLPGMASLDATRRLVAFFQDLHEDDLVICLLSGGASALMTLPLPGITLMEMQALTGSLLGCGATINEINCLRKHLDQVKGGRLAGLIYPAHLATLILSDVIGNPLDVIASGPTVADPTTYSNAFDILQKYQLLEKTPESIKSVLLNGAAGGMQETLKDDDPKLKHVQNVVVGSNYQAATAALRKAQQEEFDSILLTTYLQGEARDAGGWLGAILKQMSSSGEPLRRPGCMVVGGETTVVLKGHGKGGRNQELALGAVAALDGLKDVALVTLATDGEDGPTDAAGAIVTGETAQRAGQMGMNVADYLADNNAYEFFDRLGDLLRPGSTGTNVNDLVFLFAF
jgi:glycerate 2-kinase